MFDATLRQAKDRVGTPLALRLGAVSPNAVSVGGFVVGLIAAWQASQGNGVAAVILWLFSRILDGLAEPLGLERRGAELEAGHVSRRRPAG